jgi:anti-anti-sigma factor
MDMLTITREEGTPVVLHVTGELDIATADQLREALDGALARDGSFVLDLAGVSFVGVAGLRVILEAANTMNGNGPLTVEHGAVLGRLADLVGLGDTPSIDLRGEA